jgi:hypothetical protein
MILQNYYKLACSTQNSACVHCVHCSMSCMQVHDTVHATVHAKKLMPEAVVVPQRALHKGKLFLAHI